MAHADAHSSGATLVEEGGDPGDSHKENDSKAAADADDVWEDSDAKLPAPLSNGAYRKILKELPDGPRIAAETCVKFWKVCLACICAQSMRPNPICSSCAPPAPQSEVMACVVGQEKKFPTEELVAFLKTISVHRCASLDSSILCFPKFVLAPLAASLYADVFAITQPHTQTRI